MNINEYPISVQRDIKNDHRESQPKAARLYEDGLWKRPEFLMARSDIRLNSK